MAVDTGLAVLRNLTSASGSTNGPFLSVLSQTHRTELSDSLELVRTRPIALTALS